MTEWNHDLSAAPRGRYETRTRTVGGNTQEYTVFISERVLIVDETGKVFGTAWVEPGKYSKNGRWGGWCEGQEPIAWAPWPTYEFAAAKTSDAALTTAPMNVSLPVSERSGEGANEGGNHVTDAGNAHQISAGELVSNSSAPILEDVGSGQ